jgi:hypothetical protein
MNSYAISDEGAGTTVHQCILSVRRILTIFLITVYCLRLDICAFHSWEMAKVRFYSMNTMAGSDE